MSFHFLSYSALPVLFVNAGSNALGAFWPSPGGGPGGGSVEGKSFQPHSCGTPTKGVGGFPTTQKLGLLVLQLLNSTQGSVFNRSTMLAQLSIVTTASSRLLHLTLLASA